MAEIDNLIKRLRSIITSEAFGALAYHASQQNPWFTQSNIEYAVEAIAEQMLDPIKVERWLASYDIPSRISPRRVGIVMAGNIPMVGFFDLLCVLVVGHTPVVKLSSKDSVLMGYVAREMGVEIVADMMTVEPDMLIATGSSQTAEIYASHFANLPTIIRGERHSIAILSGDETEHQLRALTYDMFRYWGFGCRNVNHIYTPRDFDLNRIPEFENDFAPLMDSYRYHRALYSMQQRRFIDRGNYLIVDTGSNTDFMPPIGVIGCSRYDRIDDIHLDYSKIQCVVSTIIPNGIAFGMSQNPLLKDYPDGIDVVEFLLENS